MALIKFLKNEAGKTEGLAYAGFETFRGSPYTSCARETGQNSRDAAAGEGPVKVEFLLHRLEQSEVPFAAQLQLAINQCLNSPQDQKTKKHLELALNTVSAPIIKVLEISDFNTTGLTGPIDDDLSIFNALVKSDGITNKPDPTSAGSFGIGKNAAYAVSDLQTVIYSTCFSDPVSGEKKFAAQGRLRLISHNTADGKFSAEGYWGDTNFKAIEDASAVPAWMRRTEIGTSIYSVGFREEDHWDRRMTLSLVSNFFLAIERGEIEFSIGEKFRLNRNSLDTALALPELREVAEHADQVLELVRAQRLLECARSDAASRHIIKVPELGDFTLHLLVGEKLPREVHIIRNGIYITDNFSKFSEPLRRFPGTREFIAVLEPTPGSGGNGSSALLKQIENPAHDAFEPERLIDRVDRDRAKKQIKTLVEQIRKVIKTEAKIDDVRKTHVDELSSLFADAGDATKGEHRDLEKDPEKFIYGEARLGKTSKQPPNKSEEENGGGGGGGGGRNTKGTKVKGKPRTREPVSRFTQGGFTGFRSLFSSDTDKRRRTIYFTPSVDGDIGLQVFAAGLSDNIALNVVDADCGDLVDGALTLSVMNGSRVCINLAFDGPYSGPIAIATLKMSSSAKSSDK